jgi:hypothetical protein
VLPPQVAEVGPLDGDLGLVESGRPPADEIAERCEVGWSGEEGRTGPPRRSAPRG